MAALAATADFVNTPTTPITPHFPKPSPTLMVVSSSSNSPFDINLVCDRFLRSISDKAAIDTLLYLQGFTELNKFFNMFGTLFGFVAKDVRDKIGILEAYHADETVGHRYVTVQSMIEYEKGESLLIDKTGRRPSGARTLLRLHRALEFISAFLHEVTKIDDQTSTGGSARAAYGRTLARFHPWMIRKTVNLATLALPYRRVLISNVYGGALPEGGAGEVNEAMSELANIADQVFGATHKLYEEHELLELP
ncbi:PREDICTED: ceramide-1-phosphate transfer protein-like [Rhagoletis zephyria]|uniref:ceramide-1-phosphate transfer protein-like n=1 Tax=Rhagoletis zephyria TaxID=28612 RepID=UPI0008114C81|nr:PREDICTED: ceramide-1-phosphate transfer protein-like [Rhagoletis zephyria]